jgi:hypothetical protein
MSVGFFVRLAGYNRRYKGGLAKTEREPSQSTACLRKRAFQFQCIESPKLIRPAYITIFGRFRCLGRAVLDHNSPSSFAQLGKAAAQHLGVDAKMLPLLRLRQPLYFLPIAFSAQLCFDLGDTYDHSRQPLCSSHQVSSKLAALAKYLNIPLNGARLSDEAEQSTMKITNCKLCGSRHSKLQGRAWRSTAHLFARDG